MNDKKGPVISDEISKWLDDGGPFPEELVFRNRGGGNTTYNILGRDGSGFVREVKYRKGKKGFVLHVVDPATNQEFAAKLCIPEDYEDNSPLNEVSLASSLKGAEEYIHIPKDVGRVDAFSSQPGAAGSKSWVCFISDWLTGHDLMYYLNNEPEKITPSLVVNVARVLMFVVLFFESKNLKHDDLHLGNVMLVETDSDILDINPSAPPHVLKIIDLGSLKPLSRSTLKIDDDWSSLAKCLVALYNFIQKDRAVASRHPEFMRLFSCFIYDLADADPARNFPEKSSYWRRIDDIESVLSNVPAVNGSFHPFEAISAEHLASDDLLLSLFVDHLEWVQLIQSPDPTVLIGPRGCGKSMVFRYLSIRTHIAGHDNDANFLSKVGFFGVYVGCASDLQNDLLWISREKGRVSRLASEITTYFNLVLTRELLKSLSISAKSETLRSVLGMTDTARVEIADFVVQQIGALPKAIQVKGMDPLQICADLVDGARLNLGKELLSGADASYALSGTYVRELCRFVQRKVPGLAKWRIAFLLDDYTSHRLSLEVQRVLNPVVWQRDSSFIFKVSSEPHGFDPGHIDNSKIDANREYTLVDAGGQIVSSERKSFVEQLLDKRLAAAGYRGRCADLIGDSKYKNDVELACAIRGKKGERVGQRSFYYGIHVLSDAWSGDVSTILHMVREMFALSGVDSDSSGIISPNIQHKAITKVSTALRDRVSGYHPYGTEMAKVLASYGELAKKLLVESPDRFDKKGDPVYHRRYRIEMTLPAGAEVEEALSQLPNGEGVVALMRELVRRAIFVQLPSSRGKESSERRTLRWQLRASLLPSFGTSLVRESYIDIKRLEDFAEFLTNPDAFSRSTYARYAPSSSDDLFGDLSEDVL
ncbi:TPA: protein kinase family protein [Pseudomonas aeruginosa]|nr:protein kinase family protein [Pseudomonas aeruginosa]MBI8850130.1 protein kinase family protein [Pseudomonas aeruginosa]MBX5556919.1 protein kinase family protein [Pseudomonas aeruginosa]TRL52104.1 protein kinase family protein [Pseudomonas aeruginosa]HBN7720921.1 protein kinase family protein [Pseudomonas aeruginosa]